MEVRKHDRRVEFNPRGRPNSRSIFHTGLQMDEVQSALAPTSNKMYA